MAKILVIGDTSERTYQYAQQINQQAKLVNKDNFSEALGSNQATWFSALGDLSFTQLKALAESCDEIRVADIVWDRFQDHYSIILVNHLSHFCKVSNWDLSLPNQQLTMDVTRQYRQPTLWSFGCSLTAGVGLEHPELECYGKLLADKLGLRWQNIAKPGSSTMWSLTHLLHAELGPDDVVVWGTTSLDRDRFIRDGKVSELRAQNMTKYMMDYLTDEQLAFRHVFNVNCGLQYLRSKKLKFIFFSLLASIHHQIFNSKLEHEFSLHPEWCPTVDWYLDHGNDGMHPGTATHKHLAELAWHHLQYQQKACK